MSVNPYCICDQCYECDGTGTVWFSCTGENLSSHRSDDMDEPETCQSCHGSGLDAYDPDCPIHGDDDDYYDEEEE